MPERGVGLGSWGRLRIVAFVMGALLVAALSLCATMAAVAWRGNPGLALAVWPGDARALTRRGEMDFLAFQQGQRQDPALIARQMKVALAGAPLQVRALRVAGVATDVRGNTAQGAAQLLMADRISRRDLLTQLWALEEAVERGDTAGALRRYDIALRIKPDTQQLLFPILAGAVADAPIRVALRPYFQARRTWVMAFFDYAATRGDHPAALVTFLASLGAKAVLPADLTSKLLGRLLPSGDFASAELLLRGTGRWPERWVRDIGLTQTTTDPAFNPMSWTAGEAAGVSARRDDGKAQFHVFAEAGGSGQVLHRFVSLPPGRYVLAAHRRIESAGPDASEEWKVHCLQNDQFVKQWAAGLAIAVQSVASSPLILPPGCRHQLVTVSVNAGADAVALEYDLTAVSAEPVG